MAARIGVRNDNDLVWVGRAANYAAKLSNLSDSYAVYITDDVYKKMNEVARTTDGKNMWTQLSWKAMADMKIYGTTWKWAV
jgi:class 3 adenylate cyclase